MVKGTNMILRRSARSGGQTIHHFLSAVVSIAGSQSPYPDSRGDCSPQFHYKRERNTIVKLIKVKKKKYYENMIDRSKGNPTAMWKTLKKIIRSESSSNMSRRYKL